MDDIDQLGVKLYRMALDLGTLMTELESLDDGAVLQYLSETDLQALDELYDTIECASHALRVLGIRLNRNALAEAQHDIERI